MTGKLEDLYKAEKAAREDLEIRLEILEQEVQQLEDLRNDNAKELETNSVTIKSLQSKLDEVTTQSSVYLRSLQEVRKERDELKAETMEFAQVLRGTVAMTHVV